MDPRHRESAERLRAGLARGARDPRAFRAALLEVPASERDAWNGRIAKRPFVILAQPSLFDRSRAPDGKQTVWAYCHVPHASTVDMTDRIEQQIERYAPGFRDRILARSVMAPAAIEARNANLVGGDIGAGVSDLGQLFARPTWRWYSTPVRGLYICSASQLLRASRLNGPEPKYVIMSAAPRIDTFLRNITIWIWCAIGSATFQN